MKKILISSLVASLLTGILAPVTQISASAQSPNETTTIVSEEKLVEVTLYSDEDTTITAEVPESHKEEYIQKLQDKDFRQQEIANSSGNSEIQTGSQLRAAAASSVKYMRKNEVLRVLDSMNKSGNWLRYLSNPITDTAIGKAASLLAKNSFTGFAVGVLTWGAADLMSRQQKWWNDSAMMILRGQIRGVKSTVTPSGKSYPAVYRTLTRY